MNTEQLDFLIENSWVEIENYFPEAQVASLLDYAKILDEESKFKIATIKNQLFQEKNTQVRRDSIYWIDDWDFHLALKDYKTKIDYLTLYFRENLRLSIKSFEGHLAFYNIGDFYKKHIDQHLTTRHRQISFVTYLNESIGGELVIYDQADKNKITKIIHPKSGKVVIFLSPIIFHEVLPAKSERFSLTGWFRDDLPLL